MVKIRGIFHLFPQYKKGYMYILQNEKSSLFHYRTLGRILIGLE